MRSGRPFAHILPDLSKRGAPRGRPHETAEARWQTGPVAESPLGVGPWTPNSDGLVCAVAQQRGTGEVLMVAWMDDEAVRRTIATGRATYWSRSRQEYWVKGETSGHAQFVHSIRVDCDGDALLLEVDQVGPACHTGQRSCFDTASVAPEVTT